MTYSVHIRETELGISWDEYGFFTLEEAMDYIELSTSAYGIAEIYNDETGQLAVSYPIGNRRMEA